MAHKHKAAGSVDIRKESKIASCCEPGIISSGNAWERCSQSYFDSGNGVLFPGMQLNQL